MSLNFSRFYVLQFPSYNIVVEKGAHSHSSTVFLVRWSTSNFLGVTEELQVTSFELSPLPKGS